MADASYDCNRKSLIVTFVCICNIACNIFHNPIKITKCTKKYYNILKHNNVAKSNNICNKSYDCNKNITKVCYKKSPAVAGARGGVAAASGMDWRLARKEEIHRFGSGSAGK
jgi:hypothetical protein